MPLLSVLPNHILGPWLGLDRGSRAHDMLVHGVPVFFSILSVLLAFLCLRRLFGLQAAFWGSLLVAVSPYQLHYAHEFRAYATMLFFSLAGWYCLIRVLEKGRPLWWAGYVLATTANHYNHFFSVWHFLIFNGVLAIWVFRRRELLRPWIIASSVVFLLSLPPFYLAWRISHIFESITNVYTVRPDYRQFFITFKTFMAGYTGRVWLYWTMLLVTFPLFLLGLWSRRREPAMLLALLLFTVFPVVGNIIVWRMRSFPFYEHRLFIFPATVVCGVVALGVCALPDRRVRAAVWALLLCLTLPCILDERNQNIHPTQTHLMGVRLKPDCRSVAQIINGAFQPGDRVLHASHFTFFPVKHYLLGKGIPQNNIYIRQGELDGFFGAFPNKILWDYLGATPIPLEEAVSGARRVWYVESWWDHRALPEFILEKRHWLEARGAMVEERRLVAVTVTLFDMSGMDGVDGVDGTAAPTPPSHSPAGLTAPQAP
ncbi:MAG: glycosyltransferase family 39 protein [Candidatus Hydrogenedentes bacterium]|nr:glycosyltransferase family 39 protein [Candidatus Hydrogenedentota bacterium]